MRNNVFFLLALVLLTSRAFAQTKIQDTDGNTKVETEATPNDNTIRLISNGSSLIHFRKNPAGQTLIQVFDINESLFLGLNSGLNSTGSKNTVVGQGTGFSLSTGFSNTLLGHSAGAGINSGAFNTAIGQNAALATTSGSSNVSVGYSSLQSNQTGQQNVALGDFALSGNTTSFNTAVGSAALQSNTSGSNNVAVGRQAGKSNTVGGSNTAIGTSALSSTTVGGNNTAIGGSALFNNLLGGGNTALGVNAGDLSTGNSNCTFLGFDTDNTLNNNLTNSTAIGNGARINASNKIRFGNTAVTVIEGQVAYTVSDGRFKSKVQNDAPGLEFVLGLQPVTYNFDYTDFSNFLGETSVDYEVLREKEQKREMGFVAQEVENLCKKQGVDLSNIVHCPDSEADNYSVAYGQLVVPLVKAVQEQQTQIDIQKVEIEQLKSLVSQILALQSQAFFGLQTWPNPTGDVLNIFLSGISQGATLALFSADGKHLRSASAHEGVQQMDLKDLPSGIYFLQANVPGQMPVTKTVSKTN